MSETTLGYSDDELAVDLASDVRLDPRRAAATIAAFERRHPGPSAARLRLEEIAADAQRPAGASPTPTNQKAAIDGSTAGNPPITRTQARATLDALAERTTPRSGPGATQQLPVTTRGAGKTVDDSPQTIRDRLDSLHTELGNRVPWESFRSWAGPELKHVGIPEALVPGARAPVLGRAPGYLVGALAAPVTGMFTIFHLQYNQKALAQKWQDWRSARASREHAEPGNYTEHLVRTYAQAYEKFSQARNRYEEVAHMYGNANGAYQHFLEKYRAKPNPYWKLEARTTHEIATRQFADTLDAFSQAHKLRTDAVKVLHRLERYQDTTALPRPPDVGKLPAAPEQLPWARHVRVDVDRVPDARAQELANRSSDKKRSNGTHRAGRAGSNEAKDTRRRPPHDRNDLRRGS